MSNKIIKAINDRFEEEGGYEDAIEVDLSNLDLSTIGKDVKKALDKAKGIEVLVISENKFSSLDTLPDWKLSSLNASTNKLNDASLIRIAKFTELSELILSGNEIKTLQALSPIFGLKHLEEIDLSQNPVAQLPGYRELLFSKIEGLKVVDGLDREGNEVEEELEEGSGDEDDDDDEAVGSDQDFEDDDDSEEESQPKDKKKQ